MCTQSIHEEDTESYEFWGERGLTTAGTLDVKQCTYQGRRVLERGRSCRNNNGERAECRLGRDLKSCLSITSMIRRLKENFDYLSWTDAK